MRISPHPGLTKSPVAATRRNRARSAASMAFPRPSSVPATTWEQASSVMLVLAWPGSSWTYSGCLPAMRRIVAQVCRRSWSRAAGRSAYLSSGLKRRPSTCVLLVVVPVVVGNSRAPSCHGEPGRSFPPAPRGGSWGYLRISWRARWNAPLRSSGARTRARFPSPAAYASPVASASAWIRGRSTGAPASRLRADRCGALSRRARRSGCRPSGRFR
jgi:hypothetical protein